MSLTKIAALIGTIIIAEASLTPVSASAPEKRFALVIGESAYQTGLLPTAANDAGLVAQTLQAAGFDVVGARDLDATALRASLREFVDKARAAGPEAVALMYFAGYGLQANGENYLVPVDAHIASSADVALEAIRVADLTAPLAATPLKARIIILDAARRNEFAKNGEALPGGLALAQPDAGSLIAFNAAPGTIAAPVSGAYGAYAKALVEMIKTGGLSLNELFERVRLRVSDMTRGAEDPWQASRVNASFEFFERTVEAPAANDDRFKELPTRPIREFNAHDAYLAALARDTLSGYQEFLAAFSEDPLAARVQAIIAARREAMTWRQTILTATAEAYWSYLHRYARGPHAAEARRTLAHLAAAAEPPPMFVEIPYDVPPPPTDEVVYLERPYVYLADPVYALPPPPPLTVFLEPPPAYLVALPPPPPSIAAFVLPFPIFYPVPTWCAPPAYVMPPPVNVISVNIHNKVFIDPVTKTTTVTDPAGHPLPTLPNGLQAPRSGIGSIPPGTTAATTVALPTAALHTAKDGHPAGLIREKPLPMPPTPVAVQPSASGKPPIDAHPTKLNPPVVRTPWPTSLSRPITTMARPLNPLPGPTKPQAALHKPPRALETAHETAPVRDTAPPHPTERIVAVQAPSPPRPMAKPARPLRQIARPAPQHPRIVRAPAPRRGKHPR